MGLVAAGIGVLVFPGSGPTVSSLVWGGISGIGSGVGTLALYRGLNVGRMSVVASSSAVLSAVIPALVGLALGDHLAPLAWIGVGVAIPAIALVSWQQRPQDGSASGPAYGGVGYGIAAGAGFALLFIALHRAGTSAGAWPLVPGQAVSLLLITAAVATAQRPAGFWRSAGLITAIAGLLSAAANLLFLAATGHGQLAVVAVITSLYPSVTVLLARIVLAERWTGTQLVGLLAAAGAVILVGIG